MKTSLILTGLLVVSTTYFACNAKSDKNTALHTYTNPICPKSLPDPTVIEDNGVFYLYATEDIANVPILRSVDLVNWEQCGSVFSKSNRPTFVEGGGIWAPDINYVGDHYLLYYSMSVWGGEWACGIGVAESETPEGPWVDRGKLFVSSEIEVQNSIDPFYIEDDGKKYLFWGSFRGIYSIELSDDGLSVRPGAEKRQIAGRAFEATYIHKRDKYFYLFASIGKCCEQMNSTYSVVVGRSENLLGPYVDRNGKPMLDNGYEMLLSGNDRFAGPGHNAEIITDAQGTDWLLYHSYWIHRPGNRTLMLDRIIWEEGWPRINDGYPSDSAPVPCL